ncbi:MAG: dihydrofolate reductase [Gammaproteobacteria bacterium]|nr:dihydrofolate reductase [Gammaproteobacteria bacterium]
MRLSLIAAIGRNRELGLDNKLLWRLKGDMQYFKQTTLGKPIIVGRKTFESFGGKPLPGRRNIVVTRDASYKATGADVVASLDEAISLVQSSEEVMIIGGASIYEQALGRVHRMYLTEVDGDFEADTWFPAWQDKDWKQVSKDCHSRDEDNQYDYCFRVLDRA